MGTINRTDYSESERGKQETGSEGRLEINQWKKQENGNRRRDLF